MLSRKETGYLATLVKGSSRQQQSLKISGHLTCPDKKVAKIQ